MSHGRPERSAARTRSPFHSALVMAGVALVALLGLQSLSPTPRSLASRPLAPASSAATLSTAAGLVEQRPGDLLPGVHDGPLGEADGAVPDGTTVFDGDVLAVANLDPALLGALRRAATDAADDGVEFSVNSGWRSSAYQEQLLREAVAEYGSEEEAARWVATPTTSAHVTGGAVDVGSDAAAWLSRHGAHYRLCQIYGNEPWHYELRPEAGAYRCPAKYADPTDDPRMQS